MAINLVSSVTVGSGGVSSIEFTNIPQNGKELCLITSLRVSDGNEAGFVNVNNTSIDILPLVYLFGNGGNEVTGNYDSSGYFLKWWNDSSRTANVFATGKLTFPNYTRSDAFKNFSYEVGTENNGFTYLVMAGGLFESNNPVTSIRFNPQSSGTFVQNSIVSLYIIS